jgi:uncharacterized protein (TIGR01244 family)
MLRSRLPRWQPDAYKEAVSRARRRRSGGCGLQLKRINDQVSVSPQIHPEDIAAIKAAGFATIINNRPDGESPDQPDGAVIKAAAEAAGLTYHEIPLGRDGVSRQMVDDTRAVLDASAGPVLCYCRSGTRSTTLWALSQAGSVPAEAIITAAGEAGYDVSHLAGHLS